MSDYAWLAMYYDTRLKNSWKQAISNNDRQSAFCLCV